MFSSAPFAADTFAGLGSVNESVTVSGVSATGEVGTAIARNVIRAFTTGVEATTAIGGVSANGTALVSPTGNEATGALSSVSISGGNNVSVTGLQATGIVGALESFTGVGDAQISTAQSKFGGASLLLDGTGDSVVSDGTYNFGGDPFTVDMWVRPTSGTQDGIFFDSRDSTSNDTIALRQSSDNLLVLRGNATLFNINAVFSVDTWVHIAVTRGDPFGNTYSVFVDGVKQDSALFGVTATAANLHIGSDFNGSNNWEGYVDELRISTVDRYDGSNFTPETSAYVADDSAPILLHFDGANGSTTFLNSGSVDVVTVTGDAIISPSGVEATGGIGDVNITSIYHVTGVEATGAVNDVVVSASAVVDVTGVTASHFVGDVTVTGDAIVPPTGIEVATAVGSVVVTGGANVSVTGFRVDSFVGNVTVTGGAIVYPTGVSATGEMTSPTVWGRIVPDPDTTWTEIAA